MSFVTAEDLSFGYSGHPPLFKNLNFQIEKGHCLGITGPSGSGKSTLAQVVAGHLAPLGGKIYIDGREVRGPGRDAFLVHQESDLFPWLTVEKQIQFGQSIPDRAKTENLIALTKLKGFERFYPHQLSGGMKKRLSIARALAVEPKLIIFDEAFSALDLDLRNELFTDLKKIWQITHTTILLISHDARDLEIMAQAEISLKERR